MTDLIWTFALPMVLVTGLVGYLWFLAGRLGRRLTQTLERRKTLVFWFRGILGLIFLLSLGLLGQYHLTPGMKAVLEEIWKVFTQPLIKSGNTSITLATLLWVIPVLYLSAKIGTGVKLLTEKAFSQAAGVATSRVFGLANFLRYLTMVLTGIFGLGLLGIDLTAVGLFFSVLGIGLGLGLQDVVKNFFAGLVIIFGQPFKEDDLITFSGTTGRVERLRLLSTVIVTGSNETLIVPNASLVNNPLQNYSFRGNQSFIWTTIRIPLETDGEQVRKLLFEIGQKNPYRLETTDPVVQITNLSEGTLTLELGLWARDVGDRRALQSWNFETILKTFHQAHIALAPKKD